MCDGNLNFVAGYSGTTPNAKNAWCGLDSAYPIDESELVTSEEEVIWGGPLIFHFGHFITEAFHRLWYLVDNSNDERRVVFVKTDPWSIKPWVWTFFELFGLDKSRIILLETPTRFKAVIVPDQSVYIDRQYNNRYMRPYRRILERLQPIEGSGKIFLSRSKDLLTTAPMMNLNYFEEFYQNHGYKIVYPEQLSLDEQIKIVGGADEIVTFYGSLSHWALFCKPGTKFTSLTRIDTPLSKQCLIEQATGVDPYTVNISMNFMHCVQGGGVFLLGPTESWRRYVYDRFNEKVDDDWQITTDMFEEYVERWCRFTAPPKEIKYRHATLKNLWSKVNALEFQVKNGRPTLCCQAHIAVNGWLPYVPENKTAGTEDNARDLQAFRLKFYEPYYDVNYAVYYPTEGWTSEVSNGRTAGMAGIAKPIYGLKIRLTSAPSDQDVAYRVHDCDGRWSRWVRNGEPLISTAKLNAFQAKLVRSDEKLGDEDDHTTQRRDFEQRRPEPRRNDPEEQRRRARYF